MNMNHSLSDYELINNIKLHKDQKAIDAFYLRHQHHIYKEALHYSDLLDEVSDDPESEAISESYLAVNDLIKQDRIPSNIKKAISHAIFNRFLALKNSHAREISFSKLSKKDFARINQNLY